MTTAAEIEEVYPATRGWAWKIVEVANNLNIDPAWLANVMKSESHHNPRALNDSRGRGNKNYPSYAAGLIQFIPSTAKGVLRRVTGVTYSSDRGTGSRVSRHGHKLSAATSKILSMSAVEQMDLVENYLSRKGPLKSQDDVVLAVFYPHAVGKGPDFNIADHYAYKGGKYPRGTSTYNSRYNYLVALNGGITYAKDYAEKLSKTWKLKGVEVIPGVRVLPYLLVSSVALLTVALVIKFRQ